MSSKWIVLFLLAASASYAQVNLDQPIGAGLSDHAFRSAVDPKLVYYIPIGINRTGEYMVTEPDHDHLQVRFQAGVAVEDIKAVESQLARMGMTGTTVRFLRPSEYLIDPKDATDISPEFEPLLLPLGDLDLAGPMPYSLRINHFAKLFGASGGTKLIKRLFGDSGADNVGMIRYQFDAIELGKPKLARSAVGIFVGTKTAPAPVSHLLAWPSNAPQLHPAPELLNDKEANCWETVKPGQYCLREE